MATCDENTVISNYREHALTFFRESDPLAEFIVETVERICLQSKGLFSQNLTAVDQACHRIGQDRVILIQQLSKSGIKSEEKTNFLVSGFTYPNLKEQYIVAKNEARKEFHSLLAADQQQELSKLLPLLSNYQGSDYASEQLQIFLSKYRKVLGAGPFVKGLTEYLSILLHSDIQVVWDIDEAALTQVSGHEFVVDAISLLGALGLSARARGLRVHCLLSSEIISERSAVHFRRIMLKYSAKMQGRPTGTFIEKHEDLFQFLPDQSRNPFLHFCLDCFG
eukprot:TRINITY_DN13267_c0_g1::TRINITY_DN13267_c0_g1_i1::g.12693::m.12693 TRINITY_DN13267_c0_g1::TRINITY_DN13267_c0_g1_i1::g.12693  ORF type:complete len:279 (-),score=18.41 TRINITY_DN13267_c0_g1_i1:325-1161(-)